MVVSDESKAIVYGRDSISGPLRELFSLHNDVARKKMDQLMSVSRMNFLPGLCIYNFVYVWMNLHLGESKYA